MEEIDNIFSLLHILIENTNVCEFHDEEKEINSSLLYLSNVSWGMCAMFVSESIPIFILHMLLMSPEQSDSDTLYIT